MIRISPTNIIRDGVPIGDSTTFNWGSKDLQIRHFILKVREIEGGDTDSGQVPGESMMFVMREVKAEPGSGAPLPKVRTADDVLQYMKNNVLNQASKPGSPVNSSNQKTPYDIYIDDQSWLIIELDSAVNWHFARGRWGIMAKEEEYLYEYPMGGNGAKQYSGHDVHLRHVFQNGDWVRQRKPQDDRMDCRHLMFGVVHRGYGPKGSQPVRSFNLYVEFYQGMTGTPPKPTSWMPIIIDPDVGNDGGDEFPSPPP